MNKHGDQTAASNIGGYFTSLWVLGKHTQAHRNLYSTVMLGQEYPYRFYYWIQSFVENGMGNSTTQARRARVAQWWELSAPTNVVWVQIPTSTPFVGWVCCLFSPLLREVFLRIFRILSSKTNTSKFQFDLERRDTFQRFLQELLSASRVNKLQFMESVSRCQYQIYFFILAYVMSSEFTRVMKKISASLTFVLSSICIFIGIFIHLKYERFFSLFQYREIVGLHSLLIMHAGIQSWI